MINHARTLLLNVEGEHLEQPDIPGDAYIPEFTPTELNPGLEQIRQVLFGSMPDYEGQVYRTAQYMGILHSTEYAAYVADLDSRITYDPDNLGVVDQGLYGPIVVGESGLTVTGEWDEGGMTGRVNTKWRITALTEDTLLVENMTEGLADSVHLAAPKTLIGSTLTFSVAKQPLTPGDEWRVYHKSRVGPDLGLVLSELQSISNKVLNGAVFGTTPRPEPQKTFSHLFRRNAAAPYQFTGILLAYIYTLENIRTDA